MLRGGDAGAAGDRAGRPRRAGVHLPGPAAPAPTRLARRHRSVSSASGDSPDLHRLDLAADLCVDRGAECALDLPDRTARPVRATAPSRSSSGRTSPIRPPRSATIAIGSASATVTQAGDVDLNGDGLYENWVSFLPARRLLAQSGWPERRPRWRRSLEPRRAGRRHAPARAVPPLPGGGRQQRVLRYRSGACSASATLLERRPPASARGRRGAHVAPASADARPPDRECRADRVADHGAVLDADRIGFSRGRGSHGAVGCDRVRLLRGDGGRGRGDHLVSGRRLDLRGLRALLSAPESRRRGRLGVRPVPPAGAAGAGHEDLRHRAARASHDSRRMPFPSSRARTCPGS